MSECPPGVHSMFDFCPGDCNEPVEDEHEIHPITLCGNVAKTLDWLRRFQASLAEPSDWSLPLTVYYVRQPDQEDTRFEVGDVLCWDGTRVRLHSSTRQGVETCESQEALMLKFGTGQITAVASDTEEGRQVRTAVALSEAERAGIIAEGDEDTEGE